jgi:molybdate transport system ATP-binding protein
MGLSVNLIKKINGFTLDAAWDIGNELAVLLGFSGAGKSMTLQMIAGLASPDDGLIKSDSKVYFDRVRKISIPPQERNIGYVFQDLALFPHMTVMGNILYGAKRADRDKNTDRAMEMIAAFGLSGLEPRYPAEISGGQKQRVALARALMRNPDVLLLDEPFSALDYPLRLEMRRFLKEVKSLFSIPIVLVTHDVVEACELADKMIVYVNGKVAQLGVPDEIIHRPVSPEVRNLVQGITGPAANPVFL